MRVPFLPWTFLSLFFKISLFCVYGYFVFLCVSAPLVCLVPIEARKSVVCPRPGISDSCELPWVCWELNLASPEEQSVLLSTVPYFQSLDIHVVTAKLLAAIPNSQVSKFKSSRIPNLEVLENILLTEMGCAIIYLFLCVCACMCMYSCACR